MKKLAKFLFLVVVSLGLAACSKEPVKITSVEILSDVDRGSGNFNRVLKICFDKPLKSDYYHTVHFVSKEDYKLSGGSLLKPLASDPKNKCHLKNIYLYLGRNDPPGSRKLIDEYINAGNIKDLMVRIYSEKPESDKERPMDERIFSNI